MLSRSVHKWRLYAPDNADTSFVLSKTLTALTLKTETEPIDTWLEDRIVFGGRSQIPLSPHIQQRLCPCNTGCEKCCFTGFTYHWIETPYELVQQAIKEIKEIMADLDRTL